MIPRTLWCDRGSSSTLKLNTNLFNLRLSMGPSQVFPADIERATYSFIKTENAGNPKAIITPGFLSLDQILGTDNSIQFPVLTNESQGGAQRNSEQRLKTSDAFYVNRVAVFVAKEVILDGAGSAEPETWANPAVFTGADQPSIARLLNTGSLRVEVDSVVYIQNMDLMRFREVGFAQAGVAGDGASSWTNANVFQFNTPVFRFNGGSSNDVSVNVKGALTAAAPVVTDQNVLTVRFYGWLAQNCGAFNAADR